MSTKTILTTKDFSILEDMLERWDGRDDVLSATLRRKLSSATIVLRADVPDDVATLNSRVTFRINGRDQDTRLITQDRMTSPIGMFLPITTPRGLALLGLQEGATFRAPDHDGGIEEVALLSVDFQPEAAKRRQALPAGRESGFTLGRLLARN